MGESMRGRLSIVTGASRGIGLAIARALAEEGSDLLLTCSSTLPELEQRAGEIEAAAHVRIRCRVCDAADPSAVQTLFGELKDAFGTYPDGDSRLSLLVNNAGISYVGLLQDMSPEAWNRVIGTNLSSCFYTAKCAVPLFLDKKYKFENDADASFSNSSIGADAPAAAFGETACADFASARNKDDTSSSFPNRSSGDSVPGRIINISSVWGNVGASMEAAYSASKGGVNALTKALGKELAPSGIPVNAIACGCVDTVMNDNLSAEEKETLAQEIPAGRFAQPEEIARCAVHLAKAPAYLTGQIITVDGGWI